MKNWVYYMQRGLQSMWSKKPKKRTTLAGIEISEKQTEHEFTTDVITFNKLRRVPKDHPFRDREFDGAFKEPSQSLDINEYGDDDWANPE